MGAKNKRVSIGQKILLVSLCFSLPMVVLGYFVIANIDENSRIAALEISGNTYQVPLETLLRATGEHQRLIHDAAHADNGQLAELKSQIDGGLQALKAVDEKEGVALQFTPEGLAKRQRQTASVANLEKSWNDITDVLAKSGTALPPDIDAKYDALNGIINTMITHLGDTSTLILDPELDTYYTVDATLQALPQTQNRVEAMIATARDAYSHGTFTMDDRIALAADAAQLQASDIDRITGDLQTALNENANNFHSAVASFQSTVPAATQEWREPNEKLVELTQKLSTATTPPVTFEQYSEVAVKAREASFKFWDVITPENNSLLDLRIAYYTTHRNLSLLTSLAALAFSALIAFLVTRSMIVPLNKLARTLSPGATLLQGSVQQLSAAAESNATDAIQTTAIICEELAAHAVDMRKTATDLEVLVFGHLAKHQGATLLGGTTHE